MPSLSLSYLSKMFEFIDKTIPKQKKEMYNGNREYKVLLDLCNESKTELRKQKKQSKKFIDHLREQKYIAKINKRATQLQFRLEEGHGKALYMLGIKDDGTVDGLTIEQLFKSLNFLYKMTEIINAAIKNIRIYRGIADNKYICTIRIIIPNYQPKQLIII